jgi:hypothetical protein
MARLASRSMNASTCVTRPAASRVAAAHCLRIPRAVIGTARMSPARRDGSMAQVCITLIDPLVALRVD